MGSVIAIGLNTEDPPVDATATAEAKTVKATEGRGTWRFYHLAAVWFGRIN